MMEARDGRSSSNDLSSADSELIGNWSAADGRQQHIPSTGNAQLDSTIVIQRSDDAGVARNQGRTISATNDRQEPQPKQRKPRKKKETVAPGASEPEKKEKAPRKPRAVSGTTASSRKKPKLEAAPADPPTQSIPQATPDLQSSKLVQPVNFSSQPLSENRHDEAAKFSQNGFLMHDRSMPTQHHGSEQKPQYIPSPTPQSQISTPRSTAIFDPVRSVLTQRPAEPTQSPVSSSVLHTPPRPSYNPSTSPAISSIIDPPTQPKILHQSTLPTYTYQGEKIQQSDVPSSPQVNLPTPGTAMDIDPLPTETTSIKKSTGTKKSASEAPTRGSSPKPTRAKEQPPPIPPGSGLLSSSLFGGDSGVDATASGEKVPNIVIHVDLKNPNNKVINFARLAEEKYGFAALYPRQAAQRERLAKVAAAGAALERSASNSKFGGTSAGESGDDDVSVDIDRDSDNDGDIAMSGMNGDKDNANSGTDGPGPKRKRRRKVEEYDQDDPFVDDSELLWEAQAAASKDGFFVYCGPLVPEGEKPAVERADGTVKRGRGRGRGGGTGSRGGRGGATSTAEGGSGKAGGPGSRGGGATRKPRITKAERALREQEKAAREKMAPIAAKPSAYPD